MEMKFGMYKGQEESEVVKIERGRGWMRWVIGQPVKEGKFKEANIERNQRWATMLEGFDDGPSNETPKPQQSDLGLIQKILEKLELIEGKIDMLLPKKSDVVDW